jgi:hypothetical protein
MSDEDKEHKSTDRSGGVDISGGETHITGDVVGRDKKVSTTQNINTGGGAHVGGGVNTGGGKFVGRDDVSTTGLTGDELGKLFESIYARIEARPEHPAAPKADVKEAVEMVEAQVRQGEQADEKALGFSLKSLKRMAPDIWEVVVDTFTNPAKGIATVIRKVMAKAKEEAAA